MRAPGFWWEKPGAISALLSPFAKIYGSIAARRLAQPGERVGIPVICVGNPTVGGAGKTPAAIAIARLLIAAGERPMFLTRGYGGRLAGPVVGRSRTHRRTGRRRAAAAGARRADDRRARPRRRRAAAQAQRRQRHRDGRRLPESVTCQRPLDPGRSRRAASAMAACSRRARCARRSTPQLDRASAILIVGEGATGNAKPPQRTRGLPVFHARLEPDPAAVASLRGQEGSRLRRHRRSGKILRDAQRGRDRCPGPARLSRPSSLQRRGGESACSGRRARTASNC